MSLDSYEETLHAVRAQRIEPCKPEKTRLSPA